ncbi:MAG: 3',5'-cyclic-nucleotide phosphodiesterase [Cyclobacteriaceae bacterium]
MMRIFTGVFLFLAFGSSAQTQPFFKTIPLGVKGGGDESNLSAYAVAATDTEDFVCLDAGTIHSGINKAVERNVWKGNVTELLKTKIKGYLISHPHLDHVSGLILNAPDDSSKPIYGTEHCLRILQENYFTWDNWANFGNTGEKPLNKYTYKTLVPGKEVPLDNTPLQATAYTLSHVNPYESSAFLIRNNQNYLLYLGDTGSDEIEKSGKLNALWRVTGPLIKSKQLKAIFIEVSFTNEQPDQLLFGHLTPLLLRKELIALSNYCGPDALKNFPIVITHRKPGGDREGKIEQQLQELDLMGIRLIFPEQGVLLEF